MLRERALNFDQWQTFSDIWSASADHITSNILKAVLHKFYLVYS